ncbi:MAG: hypothetical protein SFH39_04370 [Candidatus Magnetobacterium sp. LHC-1]|uniref:Uncharacterized protein n=1 Tax=Candidatus Magnetobacterium casense TaxID=1455061 RepID=A0ABS6RYE3_9BACT|nr:hypothetical protein [Candidatus Magnetobacterium casensis]MBF0606633.1 hypothetical protein [Nitrospirota bacterium]MBV6341350.1 hypothetical protein [Candidatus Magnetobacterium casensis]
MDKARLSVAMIDVIKSFFGVTLDNIYEINEFSERVFLDMSRRGADMHKEAEKVLVDFLDYSKKSRDEFRNLMESGFEQIERPFRENG